MMEPIVQGFIQNPYQQFELTLAAGEVRDFSYDFDFFRLITEVSGNFSDVKIRFGSSGQETNFAGVGIGYKLGMPVKRITFRNTGASPVTFVYALGIGLITDDRINFVAGAGIPVTNSTGTSLATKDVQASAFSTSQVTLSAATAASLIAANANAKARIITAGNTDLFIGSTIAVDNTTGFKIAAGASVTIGHGLEIFGYSVAGDTVFIYEEEY